MKRLWKHIFRHVPKCKSIQYFWPCGINKSQSAAGITTDKDVHYQASFALWSHHKASDGCTLSESLCHPCCFYWIGYVFKRWDRCQIKYMLGQLCSWVFHFIRKKKKKKTKQDVRGGCQCGWKFNLTANFWNKKWNLIYFINSSLWQEIKKMVTLRGKTL